MKPLLLQSIVLLIVALPGWASAEVAALNEARQMLEDQEFEEALEALAEVREGGDLGPEGLVELLRAQAECTAALRRPEEARDAFIQILVIDPDYYVPSEESPLLREPFEQAQAHWREHERPPVQYEPPATVAPGDAFVLDLGDSAAELSELISQLSLHYRTGRGDFEHLEGSGAQLEIDADDLDGADSIELYLVVYDDQGNVVARSGSEEEPLTIEIGESDDGPSTPGGRRRFYQRWWFWTIIGAVVVGVAVGVPLGLSQSGSDDPCETALGGACDLEVHLGN